MKTTASNPLVSIYVVVRNAKHTITRCIDSIIHQEYKNIEIVVQDGASDDGTISILQKYGDKIRLYSSTDSGPAEGFHRALKRCKGEIVLACLSDESLFPHSVSNGIENLNMYPNAAAVYGDINITDYSGNSIKVLNSLPWNYKTVFCSEFSPFFGATFFRKTFLDSLNIYELDVKNYNGYSDWCVWWSLGLDCSVKYVPGVISNYSVHSNQLSKQICRYRENIGVRIKLIKIITANKTTPYSIRKLRKKAISGCYLHNAEQFLTLNRNKEVIIEIIEAQNYQPKLTRLFELVRKLHNKGFSFNTYLQTKYRFLYRCYLQYCTTLKNYKYLRFSVIIFRIKTVAIFGASNSGRTLFNWCNKKGIKVQYFVDNAVSKQEALYCETPVCSVEHILNNNKQEIQAILIASKSSKRQIKNQLIGLGYAKPIICVNP